MVGLWIIAGAASVVTYHKNISLCIGMRCMSTGKRYAAIT